MKYFPTSPSTAYSLFHKPPHAKRYGIMRINERTAVSTAHVLLVPYSAHHVPKYHMWMKDPEIQEATASEPLSLDEEYDMQQSWRTDPDKLTFIICRPEESMVTVRNGLLDADAMIGDVNMFISTTEDDAGLSLLVGELELMIAERSEHRKGYGRAALLAFMRYIVTNEEGVLQELVADQTHAIGRSRLDHFAVKIGQTNHRSITLFESLGFSRTSDTPSYFGEYELRLERDKVDGLLGSGSARMERFLSGYEEIEYVCPEYTR
ncbi:hypothetical protein PV08_04796 [Exophiala spinifera]|uniref:N-acetyltransferase domain-containing protein n=1 Tax=Exophiala spinifera TaxID=91928 RepID=A0A0D1YQW1_9EURO|nr:uncharacterized protein PV08_04796 [Exophiala spinifera]KIW17601.1 hypothetical protein PV08_04796 [Exophiala spinifera]